MSDGDDLIRHLLAGDHIQHVGDLPDAFFVHQAEEFQAGAADQNKNAHGISFQISPRSGKRIFEMEVPEIEDGLVEIRSIAREAGSRTKIAVFTSSAWLRLH